MSETMGQLGGGGRVEYPCMCIDRLQSCGLRQASKYTTKEAWLFAKLTVSGRQASSMIKVNQDGSHQSDGGPSSQLRALFRFEASAGPVSLLDSPLETIGYKALSAAT